MPPKSKPCSVDAPEDQKIAIEANRLRARASPALLQSKVPHHTTAIPPSLRKTDGADIIKRNANRKKKYLFIFPGALSLPASAGKIGSLTSLDTRTPVLNIHFPSGTLRLFGTLVFPENALLSVKPTKSAVQVLDVFETLIVFSEWRWVGDPASNPAGLPEPLPKAIQTSSQQLWRSETPKQNFSIDEADPRQLSSDSDSALGEGSDDYMSAAAKVDHGAPVRSNPRRKGRVVNYSQLEKRDSDEYDDDESDGETTDIVATKVRRRSRVNKLKACSNDAKAGNSSKTEVVLPARASRRKRRKLNHSARSEDDGNENGIVDGAEGGTFTNKQEGREGVSQRDARVLQFDDSVELVEADVPSKPEMKMSRARRNVTRIKYSQESDDEYPEVAENDSDVDDGDADFAISPGGVEEEGSDVVIIE